MKMVGGIGPSTYLTVVIFCAGLVTGLIMTSFVSNHTSVSQHMMYPSIMKSSAGRELVELVRRYNKTLSLHARRLGGHTSHDHVHERDKLINQQTPIKFGDAAFHNDDDSIAKALYNKVRVLCWVMTTQGNHKQKAIHVKATWGKRCNKLMFISDIDDPTLPATKIEIPVGRDHLTAKTMQAFDMIYKEVDNFDWFLKADDDTYVIVENLRYMLAEHNSEDPIYFGHHFKIIVAQGYFSGGGGYAVSKEALRRFGTRKPNVCAKDWGAEDVEFGRCMERLGVKTGDSRDRMGRSRFHCFNPATHIHGGYPDWYYQYDKYGGKKGADNMSDYAITFHYVDSNEMYNLEFFIYHLRPYGINSGHQHLNLAAKTDEDHAQKATAQVVNAGRGTTVQPI